MKIRKKNIGTAKPNLEIYNVRDNPEYLLAESVAAEFCDATGIKIAYYVRDNAIQPDPLYGETMDAEYKEAKETKILYEVGEIPTLYSMFGMVATDQIVAHIPQSVYYRDISQTEKPKPGDAIVVHWYRGSFEEDPDPDERAFEINHVAEDQSIFQLRSLVFVLYLMPFRFSEESDSARNISLAIHDVDTNQPPSISAYGDNVWIDTESDAMSAYNGIDTTIYGFR